MRESRVLEKYVRHIKEMYRNVKMDESKEEVQHSLAKWRTTLDSRAMEMGRTNIKYKMCTD